MKALIIIERIIEKDYEKDYKKDYENESLNPVKSFIVRASLATSIYRNAIGEVFPKWIL